MKLHHVLWSLMLMVGPAAAGRSNSNKKLATSRRQSLNDALLEKATMVTSPQETANPLRFLDEDGGDDNDDYYNYDYYSFSGFSLKYAKCQTIQRFSEDAIKNGEYSAMVKDDIVILRLCPNAQCSANKQYGCRYNYAEYALGISDYVNIMLHYTMDRRDKMCDFCAACTYNDDDDAYNANAAANDDAAAANDDAANDDGEGGRRALLRQHGRRLEEEEEDDEESEDQDEDEESQEEDDEEEESEEEDEEEDDGDEDNAQEQFDDDDYYKNDDGAAAAEGDDNAAAASDDDSVDACDTYKDECQDIASWCEDGANDDDAGYLEIEDYLNYLDCVKVEGVDNYGDSQYYIRPRCDPYQQSIHMDVYYDPYCSQYAGNDVNLREFSGIYFQKTIFEKFYDGACVDCSENDDYPYGDSNSILCNKINSKSASCNQNMMTQSFEEDDDGSSQETSMECSFIESVRYGTYNENGEIYIDASVYGEKNRTEVTSAQTAGLVISIFLCVGLGVYSCYLHHSITNLLIKSLSHSHLLPPSRHRSRKQSSSTRGASSAGGGVGGNKRVTPGDWDHTVGQPS